MDREEPVGLVPPRRWRYLIDIIVLVAVSFALPIGFSAVYTPKTMQSEICICGDCPASRHRDCLDVNSLRGERLADIGLKQPENWWRTIVIGVVAAALVFAAMYISEKAGFRRDLSRFKDAKGNLELTVYGVFYALIGAGFYEEFMFRGFLMQGMAMLFGGSRGAWMVACVLQGALFGAAHAYQNPLGVAITGTLGICPGTSGPRVRAQSLAGDHRAWTFRREPFRLVLFSRAAARVSCSVSRSLSEIGQRFSRRESNSKSIGGAMRMRLKSRCSGLRRKFVSAGLITLGTANTAERRS